MPDGGLGERGALARPESTSSPHGADLLRRLKRSDVMLASWRRSLPGSVEAWLDALDLAATPGLSLSLSPEAVAGELKRSAFAPLAQDVAMLARLAATAGRTRAVRLKLEPVLGDRCSRWHEDHVVMRLLCTYRGPGTEWLPEAGVDRARLRHGTGPNPDVCRAPAFVERFERHEVAIYKGALHPHTAGRGLVHKSPAIEGTGAARLLLTIDPSAH